MATTYTLDKELGKKINSLIRINIDSEKGFMEAAEKLESASYSQMFREIAEERSQQATELQGIIEGLGKEPEDDGSALGTAHRWWLAIREKVTTSSNYDVLAEAERGEDSILHLYQDVAKETADTGVHSMIERQRKQVKLRHDQVRNLRDNAKELKDRE